MPETSENTSRWFCKPKGGEPRAGSRIRALIGLLWLFLGVGTLASPTHPAAIGPEPLDAIVEFGGPEHLLHPMAICQDARGRIHVVDTGNHRIAIFGADGEPIGQIGIQGSGPGEFESPGGIDIGPDSLLYVADTGNMRIQILDSGGFFLDEILLAHPIHSVSVSPEGMIYTEADLREVDCLVVGYDLRGERACSLGTPLRDPRTPPHPSVSQALNRIFLTCTADDELLVGLQTVPRINCYSREGARTHTFPVRGPGILRNRAWYFGEKLHSEVATRRLEEEPSSDSGFVRDVIAACSDGIPHGVVHVQGIGVSDRDVCVLVAGVLHMYARTGELRRRYHLRGPGGQEIYVHRMWIAPDGVVLAIDMAHSFNCYMFHIPRAHRSPDEVEGRTGRRG